MRPTAGLSGWIAIAALSLVGAGCATLPAPAPAQQGAESADLPEASGPPASDVEATASTAVPPPEVREALLPPIRMPVAPAPAVEEPRFDLAVMDAPAAHFFIDLMQETPYDVVVHPDIEGTISLTLKGAAIPEIMDAVREVYGYEFRRTESGYFVYPARLQTRIFQVDYLDVQRSGRSQTRVSAGQVSDQYTDAAGVGASGTNARNATNTTNGRNQQAGAIESSQVTTDSTADFWRELAASLRAIIGVEEGRSVVVSPQPGIVVVRAMPDELRHAEEFLSRAQASLQRQVILEAKILEVELNDGFRAGINWALLIETGGKSILAAQTGGATILGGAVASEIVEGTDEVNADDFGMISNLFRFALELDDFSAVIEMLETQGRVRVLSSPRISTVNNQKAIIKVGSDEFFVTDVSTTTVTGTATTTTPDVTLTPFFSGIALDVTPQISSSGEVILHVHPSVSEVVDQTKMIEVAGERLTLPLASSTIRESDSIVRARSGQMVAIGGLMKELLVDGRASNPWLGRIPYLGALFRQTRNSSRKSELVILLRPTVVGEGTWARELRRQESRLDLPPRRLEAPGMSAAEAWSSAP